MDVKSPGTRVPTLGWTRRDVAATIRRVTQQQRDEIAARVRAEMERQGFTNSKLARSADLSEKTISRLINGQKDPRYDTLERVAKALGVEETTLRGPPLPPLGLGESDSDPEPDIVGKVDQIQAQVNELHGLLLGDGRDAEVVAGIAARLLRAAASPPSPADDPPRIPRAASRRKRA